MKSSILTSHIGLLKIRCYRSPTKESEVLDLVHGHLACMQGTTEYDTLENNVRVIDFIRGPSFFHSIPEIPKKHEAYFFEDLPLILHNLAGSIEALAFLHQHHFCHGDIRTDHILGRYRWIDFDLKQDVSDFDLWSVGSAH